MVNKMKLLVGTFFAGAVLAALAGTYDFDTQGGKYSYTYPYFVVNVAGDCTLAESTIVKVTGAQDEGSVISHADFLRESTGTFVKDGTGTLLINEALDAWTGDMHVLNGVMHVNHLDGFGPSSGNNSVFVHNGATLLNENPPGVSKLDAGNYACRRVIAFEGEGYNSLGALRVINEVADSTWCLMCYPTLTGDATLVLDNRYNVFLNWRPQAKLRLNGYTLRLKPADGRTRPTFNLNNAFDGSEHNNLAGTILADNTYFTISQAPSFEPGGVLILTNKSSIGFNGGVTGRNKRNWSLYVLGDLERWYIRGDNDTSLPNRAWTWDPDDTAKNSWEGSVFLGGNVPLYNGMATVDSAGENVHLTGVTFNGPIAGPGGFVMFKHSNSRYYREIALQLNNLENSFTGGVALGDGGRLIVRGNGALPAAGAACSITNGSMILCGSDALSLPALKFDGTGLVERASFAGGVAPALTKTGEGALVWNTSVGANLLELEAGRFVYPKLVPDIAMVAGLLEYTNTYTEANFLNGTVMRVDSHAPVMAPLAAYNMPGWSIPRPDGSTTEVNYIYSYRGYIWNRGESDATWSMVSVMDKGARVIIDGEVVVDQFDSNPAYSRNHAKTGNVTLSPGPHEFEFRYFSRSGNSGATGMQYGPAVFSYIDDEFFPTNSVGKHDNPAPGENGGLWASSMGFGIDYEGRRSHVYTDYEKAIDRGDGMLFTYTTNVLEMCMSTPVFGAIVANAGTVLDLSTREVTLPALTGLPTVDNGTLKVTGEWRIPAGDIAAGASLAGSGRFMLGEEAQVSVDDAALLPRSGFSLVTASGGAVIPASFNGARLDARGRYRLAIAGNALNVEYSCGTKLILR